MLYTIVEHTSMMQNIITILVGSPIKRMFSKLVLWVKCKKINNRRVCRVELNDKSSIPDKNVSVKYWYVDILAWPVKCIPWRYDSWELSNKNLVDIWSEDNERYTTRHLPKERLRVHVIFSRSDSKVVIDCSKEIDTGLT